MSRFQHFIDRLCNYPPDVPPRLAVPDSVRKEDHDLRTKLQIASAQHRAMGKTLREIEDLVGYMKRDGPPGP